MACDLCFKVWTYKLFLPPPIDNCRVSSIFKKSIYLAKYFYTDAI
jgi:hypothetical protein